MRPRTIRMGAGLLLLLVAKFALGLLNLISRLVFRFGWDLRVSRDRSRWPYRRKTVLRRRFRSKTEAMSALPASWRK